MFYQNPLHKFFFTAEQWSDFQIPSAKISITRTTIRFYDFPLYKLYKYKFNEYIYEYGCNDMTIVKQTLAEFIAKYWSIFLVTGSLTKIIL